MTDSASVKAQAEVAQAEAELLEKRAALERIERLKRIYPDLERHDGRWNRVVYCSALVNEEATSVFFRFSCGCCGDSPLEAWPYVKTEHGDVYSKPACFYVGERHWVSGAKPSADWSKPLRNAKVADAAIERIKARFVTDRQARINEASDETVYDDPEPFI